MIKKGKLQVIQDVTVEGDDFLRCTLVSFDTSKYYMNIFKKNSYQSDSVLYENTLKLNGKYVAVDFMSLSKFTMENIIDVKEADDLGLNIDIPAYKDELRAQMKSITTKPYKDLLKDLFSRPDVSTKFFEAPASQLEAFAYKGGLLHKTVNLLNLIDILSDYLLKNSSFDIELLKVLAITKNIGKVNAYEFVDDVVEKTISGMHFNDNELSSHMLVEELSKRNDITTIEKNIILHTALRDDTFKGRTDCAKIKETLIITSLDYLDNMVSSFAVLKQNKFNDEQFMKLHNQDFYTGNL